MHFESVDIMDWHNAYDMILFSSSFVRRQRCTAPVLKQLALLISVRTFQKKNHLYEDQDKNTPQNKDVKDQFKNKQREHKIHVGKMVKDAAPSIRGGYIG